MSSTSSGRRSDRVRRSSFVRVAAAFTTAVCAIGFGAGVAQSAGSHAQIEGSGSSWSSNAINQWVADVDSKGLRVVFTASGSAQGRKDFAFRTTDFAVSDIGYAGTDQFGGSDTSNGRAFAYLPVVAGGTAFPYQVKVGGQLKRNLRLSGLTLAKIFTGQITNWNDPAITADNNGQQLPSLKIIPVVHSEGSGSTAQFTRYLDNQFPDLWRPFQGKAGLTEFFPAKSGMIAQNGSDGVMNFIASGAANGAIGYDEYSYALGKNFPVAKIGNAAGYFTLPDQYNVAVALTQAQINMDKGSDTYLLQILDKVYTYSDPRTYPLSSYSYMIIPTAANDPRMNTAKRQTIADFLSYSTCEGQKEIGPLGYSPLPINLAQASFDQIGRLKEADAGVDLASRDLTQCDNPTFDKSNPGVNLLAQIAPQPPACDKSGAGPCGDSVGNVGNPVGGQAPSSGGGSGAAAVGANTGVAATAGGTGDATGTKNASDTSDSGHEASPAQPRETSARGVIGGITGFAGILVVIILVMAIALPPIVVYSVGGRRAFRSDERGIPV